MMTIVMIILGLLLFLAGLRLMSFALESMLGTSFTNAIQYYTGNRISAFICGLLFTAVTQSSSLATIIVVGVVGAGLIPLKAAIAVIIGANVGTTFTGQLLSFQIYDYVLLLAATGIFVMVLGSGRKRNVGMALTGLAVLLFGLKTMGSVLGPASQSEWLTGLMRASAVHPIAGVALGALTTSIVQSSSAVVALTLSLAREGALNLTAGAAILVGADVGTCVDTLLAALVSNTAARQAAFAHLLFNVFSVLLILPIFSTFIYIAEASSNHLPKQLANAHTLYNLSGAIFLLLFLSPFQKLVESLIRSE